VRFFALLAFCFTAPLSAFADPSYNVVFIGDSITEGAPLGKETSPVLCGKELHNLLQADVYISNQGHSGSTTVDWRSSKSENSFLAHAKAAAGDLQTAHPGQLIFSIMLGTNDSAIKGPNGAPVSPEDYGKNLGRTIDDLLTAFPEAKVVLHNPLWYSANTQNSSEYLEEGQKRVATYPPVIAALAASYATTKPGHVYQGDQKGYSYFEEHYLTNFRPQQGSKGTFYLHPNPEGARHLAQFWAEAIAATLKAP